LISVSLLFIYARVTKVEWEVFTINKAAHV